MLKKTKEKIGTRFKNQTKDSRENIQYLKELSWFRLKNLLKNRQIKQSIFHNNFPQVLEEWGIEEHEIHKVCTDLFLRILVYGFMAIIGLLLCFQNMYFSGFLVLLCAFLGMSTTLWRIHILKNKEFVSFVRYILLFPFFKKFFKG